MVDVHTKEQRSYNMSQVKSKDTKPELVLRKYLFSNGIRGYRLHSDLPGKPDIVFTKYKLAIFIDGCFWHKCPECFKPPSSNIEFWEEKLSSNVLRDEKVNKQLANMDYKVIRFWEHQIIKDLYKCYLIIYDNLKSKGFHALKKGIERKI